jgi:hypothetical protein
MLIQIQKTIEKLKIKVKHNVDLINKNQDSIKHMLKHSSINEYGGQLDEFNSQNQSLLAQNNDLINVQLTLISFIEKYKGTAVISNDIAIVDIYSITDGQEIFALTIKEIIPFDEKHPHYTDSKFIDKLVAFYESKEDYEFCERLLKLKQSILS